MIAYGQNMNSHFASSGDSYGTQRAISNPNRGTLLACAICKYPGDNFFRHTEIGQRIYEGMDYLNRNWNPSFQITSGIYSGIKGKDIINGTPVSKAESANNIIMGSFSCLDLKIRLH